MVETLEAFEHVAGVALPVVDFAVRVGSVYEVGSAILAGEGVTMIVEPQRELVGCGIRYLYNVHVCEKITCIAIIIDRVLRDNTKCLQLRSKCGFANNKLRGVGPI